MAKYTNRLKARLAYARLCESAKEGKNWIVTRKLILETEEGDVSFDAGEEVEIGATPEGDMGINGSAACVVITDPELAAKIADTVVNADETSDVEFVTKDAVDAVMDGEAADQVVDDLADDAGAEDVSAEEEMSVEVPELDPNKKESVEAKFAKFSTNRLNPKKVLVCESIMIDEESSDRINMYNIKCDRLKKESFNDYKTFSARVSELKGSLQPGKREIALTEAGEVMGSYDTEADAGTLYPENSWSDVDAMDNADTAPVELMNEPEADMDFDAWNDEGEAVAPAEEMPEAAEDGVADVTDQYTGGSVFESCLKKYEESAKSGKDYIEMVNSLEKAGLKESAIAKVVSTFDSRKLNECVRVYDTKYGKYVNALKESVAADNFIEETGEAKRFSKRFFN
ncbi:MAG: hypothetical protein IKO49_02365 [Bacilli bacterium]|nr:hypothetical protein [Clostridia bacterium]MBR4618126.1 hypothetical protein [Bacilli bacterium]